MTYAFFGLMVGVLALQQVAYRAVVRDKAKLEQMTGYQITPNGTIKVPVTAKPVVPYGD